MASIQFIETGATYFICYVDGLNSSVGATREIQWYVNNSYVASESISASATSSMGVQLPNLSPSTVYTIVARVYYSSNFTQCDYATTQMATAGGAGGGGTITYPQPMIQATSTTDTISVVVTNMLVGEYKTVQIFINGQPYSAGSGSTVAAYWACSISGLSAGTYTIVAQVYYMSNPTVPLVAMTTATISAPTVVRPAKFAWTYPKTSGQTFNLTAVEWNDLTANINAVRQYYKLTPYSFTAAIKGNNFLASMYNECLYAISPMYPTLNFTLSEVSSGDDIKADALNYLVTLVNNL